MDVAHHNVCPDFSLEDNKNIELVLIECLECLDFKNEEITAFEFAKQIYLLFREKYFNKKVTYIDFMVPLHKMINHSSHPLYKHISELIMWFNIYIISCKTKDDKTKETALKKFKEVWENIDLNIS